ncbi:unannotated protein [freshwater metagenome]|uniref:Unannotated protein n=1 Tax=freshwater metagenome TaxID=449393 RepID=A0A6J7DGM5_9ZZZZ
MRKFLGITCDVGLVDESVIVFKAIQNRRICAKQLTTIRDDCFEDPAPPRKLKFGGDDVARHDSSSKNLE